MATFLQCTSEQEVRSLVDSGMDPDERQIYTVAEYKKYLHKLGQMPEYATSLNSQDNLSENEFPLDQGIPLQDQGEISLEEQEEQGEEIFLEDDEIINEVAYSAIDLACLQGDVDLATWLINCGADCHFSSYCAIYANRPEMLELLLQHGKCRDSTLIQACENNCTDLVHLIFKYMKPQDFQERSLVGVIKTGNVYLIDYLLSVGIDVNQGYYTPLIAACKMNDITTVNKLLIHGAKPNYGGMEGSKNPIECACSRNNLEIVETLLQFGAKPTEECLKLTTCPKIAVALAKAGVYIGVKVLARKTNSVSNSLENMEFEWFYSLLPYVSRKKAMKAACYSKRMPLVKAVFANLTDEDRKYKVVRWSVNDLDILEYVLSLGFNPNHQDAITYACFMEPYHFKDSERTNEEQEKLDFAVNVFNKLVSYGAHPDTDSHNYSHPLKHCRDQPVLRKAIMDMGCKPQE